MKTIEKIFAIFLLSLTATLIAVSLSLILGAENYMTAGLVSPLSVDNKTIEAENAEILFAGDIMLDRGVKYYSQKAAGENANDFVFEKIHNELLSYDLVVANLEGPITDNNSISVTAELESPESFFFTFDPSWTRTLFENNIRLVNLGNNHILNFGGRGLAETKNYLEKAGVDYFGSPDQPKTAFANINGVKIAFISYNEFASYKELESKMAIEEIKKSKVDSDIVVVYAHWGAEYVKEPPLQIKALARQFIDEGADLIIGSHPHVIQPIEIYKGKRIYYSLGNFIFDQYFSEETQNGIGVVFKINPGERQLEFKEINFYTQPNGQTIISEQGQN